MKQKNGGWRHGGGLFRRPIRPESGRFGIRFRRNRCESEKGKLKKKKKKLCRTPHAASVHVKCGCGGPRAPLVLPRV